MPTGIKIIVQQQIKPIPPAATAKGTSIKSQKQAEKIAPVNLNPSHSINDNKPIQIIKPNIFFTFLSLS